MHATKHPDADESRSADAFAQRHQGETMRQKPCLQSSDVLKMAAACKAEAEKNKWSVTIAIVDDAGVPLYLERMDGARITANPAFSNSALSSWAVARGPNSAAPHNAAFFPRGRRPNTLARAGSPSRAYAIS